MPRILLERPLARRETKGRNGASVVKVGVWGRLHGIDPGLSRFRMALQSLLALVVGGGSAMVVLSEAGQSARTGVLGGMVAMMGVMLVQRPTFRAKLTQIGYLALAGAFSAALAAALSAWPLLCYAGFLGVMAGAAWAQRWERGRGIGMIAFMAYFNALFLRVGPEQILWLVLAVALGFLGLALVVLVLVPDRAQTRVRRLLPGFRARMLRLVSVVREVAAQGSPDRAARALVEATADVQETALLIDAMLENPQARAAVAAPRRLRDLVFTAEVLADHLAAMVMRTLRTGDASARERLVRQLRSGPAQSGQRAAPHVLSELLPPHPAASAERAADLLSRLTRTLDSLESAGRPSRASAPVSDPDWPEEEKENAGTGENGSADAAAGMASPARRLSPATRKTVQVTLAGALSIVVGMWLSEVYWYYAVIGAFFTLLTTPTRGASVRKAVDRILGTTIGVAGGVGLAALLAGSVGIEVAVIFALAFVAFWSFQSSYMVVIFLFTAMIALVYDLMGVYTLQLLLVRLWETLIGAGFGALAALVVLPVSTRGALNEQLAKSLSALDELLGALDPRSPRPVTYDAVYGRIREFDRAVAAFRTAGKPLESILPIRSARDTWRDVLLLSSLRFRARDLATANTGADGLVHPVALEAAPALDVVRRRAEWIRQQITRSDAPGRGRIEPVTVSDEQALGAAPGRTGDAVRAIYERLESFAESFALSAAVRSMAPGGVSDAQAGRG